MIGLPETVDDYDYGLKTALEHMNDEVTGAKADRPEANAKKKEKAQIEFPPDAFLMVTQTNWEDDVVWNGEDMRNKVMQKLNSKTNAAGWVPTGFNRTAGLFSGGAGANVPGAKPGGLLPVGGVRLQTLGHKRPENGDDTFYSIFPVENEELSYGRNAPASKFTFTFEYNTEQK
jgi:transcription initiation factor TFIID subunit 1